MRKNYLLFLICLGFTIQASFAQKGIPKTSKPILLPKITPSVVTTRVITAEEEAMLKSGPEKERNDLKGRDTVTFRKNAPAFDKDPVIQQNYTQRSVNQVTVINQFDAFNYQNVNPPDPSGDAGIDRYVTSTNGGSTLLAVYDKSGTLIQGNITFQSLGTLGAGIGDPIVLYDEQSNRWFISEMTNSSLRIYVSQTSNPIGTYFQYQVGTGNLPDYPKYAIWNDKLIVTSNQSSVRNVYVMNKADMIAGNPITAQQFFTPRVSGFGFQATTPADVDGPIAPDASSLPVILRHRDDERIGSGTPDNTQDWVDYWTLNINFTNPAASVMTGPISIGVAEFDSDLCGLTSFNCFPQPGTTTTLDPLREVLMYRVQYRKFPAYESMVMNWVVDVNGANRGGIRWTELRKTGASWFKFQEGTYAPADDLSRWMGSIAQDKHGNISMAYCVSSTTKFPSLRITGRKLSDPPGQMTEPETEIATGTNRSLSNRWGDYQHLGIDPATDENFWFTGLYATANQNWRTRIAHYKFNNCLNPFNSTASTTQNNTCFGGNNGAIKVTTTGGGTPPFQYSLNGGTPQAADVFSNLAAGTYNITVTDAAGCTAVSSATVTEPLQITINQTVQNVLCNGGNNGTITVTASNGVGTLSYQLNSGTPQAGNVFTNLAAGIYTITVRDANNCSSQKTITVAQPAVLTSSEANVNISCNGGNNGSITITPAGGTGPYQYKLNNGALQTSNQFINLTAAAYNITITDANNCSVTKSVTLTQPAAISNTPSFEEVKCFGAATGKITVTAAGGVSPFQYKLGTGVLQSSNVFNNLSAGTYNVIVTDANNCEVTQSITVTQRPQLVAAITAVNPDAGNRFVGSLSVAGSGGTAPYEYSNNGGAYQTSGNFSNNYVIGQNTISIKDANGCTITSSKIIELIVTPDTWKSFIKVYPNPSDGRFSLEIRGIEVGNQFSIVIFDQKGSLVNRFETGSINSGTYLKQLNNGQLSAGVYTMRIQSAKTKEIVNQKLVIAHK